MVARKSIANVGQDHWPQRDSQLLQRVEAPAHPRHACAARTVVVHPRRTQHGSHARMIRSANLGHPRVNTRLARCVEAVAVQVQRRSLQRVHERARDEGREDHIPHHEEEEGVEQGVLDVQAPPRALLGAREVLQHHILHGSVAVRLAACRLREWDSEQQEGCVSACKQAWKWVGECERVH